MKPKQKKDLAKAVKSIVSYSPKQPPKKPGKAPSKAELSKKWKLR